MAKNITAVALAIAILIVPGTARACEFGAGIPFWDSFNRYIEEQRMAEEWELEELAEPDDLIECDGCSIPMEYIGEYELTFYNDEGTMAGGKEVYDGAIASCYLPMGTKVYVEGWGEYTVEDTGNPQYLTEKVLDVWVPWTTAECYEVGRVKAKVYLLNE